MVDNDPFDILRSFHAAGRDKSTMPDEDLLASIIASSPAALRRARRRRLVLIAVATALALGSVAAAWYLTTRPVDTLAVTCYADTSLTGDRHGTVAAGATPSEADCHNAWTSGILTSPSIPPGTVPPLTSCVDDQGGLAVFPTDRPRICEELGLFARAPDRPEDHLGSIVVAQQQITDFIQSSKCHTLESTEAAVRDILAANGLTDWTYERQTSQPNKPCGSVAYDVANRVVVIVPNIAAP